MALQQPHLFDTRAANGVVVPTKIMTRIAAHRLAAERNARPLTRPGTFGSGLWRVRKAGSPGAPFWYVEEQK